MSFLRAATLIGVTILLTACTPEQGSDEVPAPSPAASPTPSADPAGSPTPSANPAVTSPILDSVAPLPPDTLRRDSVRQGPIFELPTVRDSAQ